MSRNQPQPGTEAYYAQFHGLEPGHPDYRATTLRTLGGIAAGIGVATWIALGVVNDPSPRPADRPSYEMPAGGVVDPAPGIVGPVSPYGGRVPGPEEITQWRESAPAAP